jgi:hypothetical protein
MILKLQGVSKKRVISEKSVTQKTHFSSKSPLQLFLKIASNFKSKLVPYEDKKNCDQQFRLFDEKCVFWVTDFG